MGKSNLSFSSEGWSRKEKLKIQLTKLAMSRLRRNPARGAEVFAAFIEVSMELLVRIVPDKDHQMLLIREIETTLLIHNEAHNRDN
jgi:hypothetical protein